MSNPIETTFVHRLEFSGLYGDPTDGLLPALMKRYGNVTVEQAEAAAEIVIRTHNAGAFPKFPVCEKALREAMAGKPNASFSAAASSGITAANYSQNVMNWKGKFNPGALVIVHRAKNPAAWETWLAYYRQLGMAADVSALENPGRYEWTVPTLYPHDFDRAAPLPLTDEQIRAIRNPGLQRRTEAQIGKVAGWLQSYRNDHPARRRRERVVRQHIDEQALARWEEETAASPLTASPSPELVQRISPPIQYKDAAE